MRQDKGRDSDASDPQKPAAATALKIGGQPRTGPQGGSNAPSAGKVGGGGAATGPVQRKPDPDADQAEHAHGEKRQLLDWEIPEELDKLQRLRIDDASIRTVQEVLQTPPTGKFNAADVRALSQLRVAHGLSRYLEFSARTIDLLIQQGIPLAMHDELIHLVADTLNIDTRSETLSIRHSATLMVASSTNFDPAGLRMVLIGDSAFHSMHTLSRAIYAELAKPVPDALAASTAGGPTPTVLKPVEATDAAGFNAATIDDPRAVRAIQSALGAPVTGTMDAATAQFVASRQQLMNIAPADGIINEATLQEIIASLGRGFGEESAIRVIIDFFRIPDDGVTSVTFDPTLHGVDYRIENRGTRTAPAVVLGVDAFAQPPARIAHTVGRAFEEVRLRQAGTQVDVRSFLLERFVTSGSTMADEDFVPFMADAVQALAKFKALAKPDQASVWTEFEEVRNKVITRWMAAAPADQQTFQQVEDEYMAMRPPGP